MEKIVLIKPSQFRRLALMLLLLLVAFAGLGYRLVDLQVLQHEKLSSFAARRQSTFLRPSRRGDILDSRGNVLATTVFVKTVCADPSLIGTNQPLVARALAPLLKMSEAELIQRLQPRVWTNENREVVSDKYVLLKHKVSFEDWQKIRQAMKELSFGVDEKRLPRSERAYYRNLRHSAIYTDPVDDQLRVYPNGSLAAHILGFVGTKEHRVDNRVVTDLEGRDSVERKFNEALNGTVGWRQTEVAPGRGELVVFREQDVEARPGLNVVLTIDSGLQDIVESELARAWTINTPVSITAIVVRPRTGEILALANLPTFDPNKPGGQMDNLRNRAIADVAEPGSTFKIVVIAGAMNEGVVDLTDPFDCENGVFNFMGYALHDTHHYGSLTVSQIIAKSSNIGAAKVGIKLGAPRLYEYVHAFGFGEPTGIALPGEQKGFAYPLDRWTKLSISRIPVGYEVAVTPLQTVMAMSAIANRGRLMRPTLVSRLEDQDKNVVLRFEPQAVRQVISEQTAKKMVEALKLVVTDGTGVKAKLDHYVAAGKTGTARKAGKGGYLPGKYFSSFIGFFPADDPELCISVVMDEPVVKKGYYGGETAGPIFKAIAERAAVYLGIRPADSGPVVPATNGGETLAETPLDGTLTTAQTGRNF